MKVAMLLALASLSIAQAAEPTGTLTLACKGERVTHPGGSDPGSDDLKEPISMGIIVNFEARTLNGFGEDWSYPNPIRIHNVTETLIPFGYTQTREEGGKSIQGSIDRVTGDVNAVISFPLYVPRLIYSLKCKPTQRMF